MYGMDVTVSDPTPPLPTVAAEGLLAGGVRNGSDPVVISATDNTGVRRVELWDVTAGAARLVGARDGACSARLAKPCPDLTRAGVTPASLPVGTRSLLVRTIDGGGNSTDRGPYSVAVVTPSDRGAVNGAGATPAA